MKLYYLKMLVQECANSYGYKLLVVQFETAFSTSASSFEAIKISQTKKALGSYKILR